MARPRTSTKASRDRARAAAREPGISAFVTRAILQELDARSIAAEPLLRRNGLTRELLQDPDAWVPQRSHAGFYRDAIAASGDPAFGVAAGRNAPIQATRAVGHCAALSVDLREAIETWGRFSELVVDDTEFGVHSTPVRDVVYWSRPPALPPLHDDGPSFASALLGFIRHTVGEAQPRELRLTGPPPARSVLLQQALGVPVRWNADRFEMHLPAGTLDRPLRFADPALRDHLVRAAQREVAMRKARSTSDRVRAAILQVGFDRSAEVSGVARLLGTTPRTLQRRLAAESRTFSEVRAAALRDAAIGMLAEEGASVVDVAFRLGFSSRAAFHRAVRRWTGRTPGDLRRGVCARP